MGLKVISPGALLTIQDEGRHGFQRYGIPESGACDRESMHLANILTGNELSEAVLETAIMGPVIEFTTDSVIAITGADMEPLLDGRSIEMYRALRVSEGSVLSFRGLRNGLRTYISLAGGIKVDPVMGSCSLSAKAGIGGLGGRPLYAGDILESKKEGFVPPDIEYRKADRPRTYGGSYEIRIIPGPEDDRFTEEGMETFLNSEYTISGDSDRMGLRLTGPAIRHKTDGNIISNGIPLGAIQVADNGQPIIMLADRQTSGGYAKIGCACTEDMPYLAQARPGDRIRFRRIEVNEAQELILKSRKRTEELKKKMEQPLEEACGPSGIYVIRVGGKEYRVEVQKA